MSNTFRKRGRTGRGTSRARRSRIERPRSEGELVAIVKRAAANGRAVKVVGAGHSFTASPAPTAPRRPVRVRPGARRRRRGDARSPCRPASRCRAVRRARPAWAGAREHGRHRYQSIAGATSTATHGTGLRFGNLVESHRRPAARSPATARWSSATRARTPTCSTVARVGRRRARHRLDGDDPVRAGVQPARRRGADAGRRGPRATSTGSCRRHRPLRVLLGPAHALGAHQAQPPHRTSRPRREPLARSSSTTILLTQRRLRRSSCRVGRPRPALDPAAGQASCRRPGGSEYTDRSDKVFTSPRLVKFYEMEYAIPRERLPRRSTASARWSTRPASRSASRSRSGWSPPTTSRCRTAYGRATGYIAVHVYQGTPYDQYFQGVERSWTTTAAGRTGGRCTSRRRRRCAALPEVGRRSRPCGRQLDPDGRFTNPYLDRVLGPPSA